MIKALFRKQMLEVFAWVYKDKKSGKLRTAKGIAGYVLLYLLLFGILGVIFGKVADFMCSPLLKAGQGWIYWCLMGMIALFFGVFGSVFNTYSSLYQSKDNDLLLSMPIPVSRILLARLSGVYAMGLLYEMIVMIPTVIIWLIQAPVTLWGTVSVLLIPLVLSVLVLAFSAVLGWITAVVMTKVKHKSTVTVILSLLFIVAYYYVYARAYSALQDLLANAEVFGEKIRFALYPLYQMGLAAEGNALSMLIFSGIIALLLVVIVLLLSRNFLKLATQNQGTEKTFYKERSIRNRSFKMALLRKEFRRFTQSANYMLNCGLGVILMPISAVLLLWKAGDIRPFLSIISEEHSALLVMAALCLMASMNVMTAPSISLEGKNLWIVQSLPISARYVLGAKMKMQLLLTLIPVIAPILAAEWLLRPKLFFAVSIPLVTLLFVVLMAAIGLVSNLKMPNLHWTNEIIPIKQSAPTMISLFSGWGIVALPAGSYYLLNQYVSASVYVICVAIVLIVADYLLLHWLMSKGAKILSML